MNLIGAIALLAGLGLVLALIARAGGQVWRMLKPERNDR